MFLIIRLNVRRTQLSTVGDRASLLPLSCPYLEQSAATCHTRILDVSLNFPRSPRGFPLQAFLTMTFTATFVVRCLRSDSSLLLIYSCVS